MQLSEAKTLDDVFAILGTGTVSPEASVAEAMWEAFVVAREPPHYHRELTACDQALMNLSHNASSERVYYDALVKLHKALKA